ncbi:MAG TPA: TVP38/TMEM64 family protein [Anaerolineae bacterium]|nr:TVP38/TMEM64 family protein [Anaerolineae bacterium]
MGATPTDSPPSVQPTASAHSSIIYRYRHGVALLMLIALVAVVAYFFGDEIMQVVGDRESLELFVRRLGWWGPFALIATNILQIVIAPIPGYLVYVVAGYLFGPWMGGVWGSIGLLLGGMLAMWLGRRLGRPIVQSIIGNETLTRWEDATRSDSILIWGVILLSPIGDAPFLLAGLSRISFSKIFVLTIITRIPAAFIAAAIGSGVLTLSPLQIGLLAFALAIPMLILYRYQEALLSRVEQFVRQHR